MPWKFRFFYYSIMAPDDADDAGNGSGSGEGTDVGKGKGKGKTKQKTPPADDPDEIDELAKLRTRNDELAKRLEALEKNNQSDDEDDDAGDLAAKARKEREKKEKSDGDSKSLESAITFNMGAKEWLKTNESLLPKSIAGIFEQADKEVYETKIERASAIKAAIISEFFAQQANVDLLTPAQKGVLEDFRKLTKTVKQERAQNIYDSIFEPTFEMLKRLKKAEQLQSGHSNPSDSESQYKEKLMSGSMKHYLGEKK